MTRKVHYDLLPGQYEFLYGFDETKINQDEIHTDVAAYVGGVTCVPRDTEYLTPTGWKTIDTLTLDSKLAVYYDDGSIRFENPLYVHKYPANKWYDFNTRFIHQTLCPNHKIVYWNDKHPEEIKTIRCEDYVQAGCNQHYKLKNYFKTNGNLTTGFTENELRVLVAYQADGYNYRKYHTNNTNRRIGFHLKKKHKIERLISLLEKTDKPYYDEERLQGIKKGYHDIFSELELEEFKHFPKEWYQLKNRELSIIFDEVKYWDCSHKNNSGTYTYYTNNKSDRDFIQFVCASQGYCTTTYERTRNIKIEQQGKEYLYANKKEYSVSWTKGKLLSMGKPEVRTAEGGEAKYCPLTSTGMWVARCKNHIFVTGNS